MRFTHHPGDACTKEARTSLVVLGRMSVGGAAQAEWSGPGGSLELSHHVTFDMSSRLTECNSDTQKKFNININSRVGTQMAGFAEIAKRVWENNAALD